jgi:hexaprenyl-diphosphate synthase
MHVGVAFQLVDDLLDYEGTSESIGKPAQADLKAGLATAPVLFAAERFPDGVLPLIERKFGGPGDVESAVRLVAAADGLAATRRLAVAHGQLALDALSVLAPSAERTALAALVSVVLGRTR